MKVAPARAALYLLLENAHCCGPGQNHARCFWLPFDYQNCYYVEGCWHFEVEVP
jgi:hypothetical protein